MNTIVKKIRKYQADNRGRWTYYFENEIIDKILEPYANGFMLKQSEVILNELEQFVNELRSIITQKGSIKMVKKALETYVISNVTEGYNQNFDFIVKATSKREAIKKLHQYISEHRGYEWRQRYTLEMVHILDEAGELMGYME